MTKYCRIVIGRAVFKCHSVQQLSIHTLSDPLIVLRAAGVLLLGTRQGEPCKEYQSVTGLTETQPFTHSHNVESPINLTSCLWIVGGNWSTWRKATQAQREHANFTASVGQQVGTHDFLAVRQEC